MSHLKLMKLLYLADRESFRLHGYSMSGDHLVAMPHGPVLSMTLNLMDGDIESKPGGWEQIISDKENHELSLKMEVTPEELDELSKADIEILEAIWQEFGKLTRWQIRDFTHDHCKEWEDPHGSSYPISIEKLFQAVGRSAEEAKALSDKVNEEKVYGPLSAAGHLRAVYPFKRATC